MAELGLTHLLAFVLGVATWLPFTLWEGRRLTSPKEPHVDTQQQLELEPVPTTKRGPARTAVILLAASTLLVGFGVQQALYQHDTGKLNRCLAAYNADVEQVRDDRLVANQKLTDAKDAKDEAGDQVLLSALEQLQLPQAQRDPQRLTLALVRFARKKSTLADVQATTTATLNANAYPTLDCP